MSSLQSRPAGRSRLAADTSARRLQRCNVVSAARSVRCEARHGFGRVSSIRDAIKTARDNASSVLTKTSPGVKFASLSFLGVAPFVSLPVLSSGDGGNLFNGNGGEGGGGDGGGGDGGGEFGRGPQEMAVVADAEEDVSSEGENEGGDDSDGSDGSSDSGGSSDEEEEEEGDGNVADGFFCSDIKAQGLPVGEGIPTEEDLFASLNCQAGFTCSRSELSQDIKQLYNTGLFESVNAKVLPEKKGKFSVVFDFVEKRYPEIKTFAVEGARVLPKSIVEETNKKLEGYKGQAFTMETMAAIKNVIEGWYQARGFGLSYISHFTGMPTGNVVAHVNEGRTAKVGVVYVDEDGNPTQKKGSIPASFILKHCPVEVGTLYSMNDGRKTLQNVFALDLFDNVQVFPKQNEKDPSRVEVDVMVREKPLQTADVEMEWAVAPNDNNRPSLVSIVPGGTITYEHRNLGGRAGTLAASVNTKSFLAPSEDMAYRMVYTQPFIYGLDDPKKTKISGTVFNSRKLCGVFTPGPSGDEVPVVWVDRAGAKVAITEQYSRNSSGSFGLVAQEISTLDENGALCPRGMRSNAYGQYIADGPPTTLSGTGKDRMVYAQGSLTRDTTYMVNGQQIGSRDIVTVDQGLGVGTKTPFFNRMFVAATRYIQLRKPKKGSTAPPITAVIQTNLGNTIGDLPVYDAFLLGGPHSVRGYNIGELAASRRILEGAVELRVPVLGKQLYGFYEMGHDLWSSGEVSGNPTEYYRRVGRGSSMGAGVKVGALRAEAVKDNNKGKWHMMLAYGERF